METEEENEITEIIFGLMAPIGSKLTEIKKELTKQLTNEFGYKVCDIKLSKIIEEEKKEIKDMECLFCKKKEKILTGTEICNNKKDDAILVKYAISEIEKEREKNINNENNGSEIKIAYVIDQLKREGEINLLNETYEKSFFLIATNCTTRDRARHLSMEIEKPESYAQELIELDQNEAEYFSKISKCCDCKRNKKNFIISGEQDKDSKKSTFGAKEKASNEINKEKYGQKIRKIFQNADIFIPSKNHRKYITRFLDLIFGSPEEFPTLPEHAMYMAFSASTRSADLSRQVGAVLVSECGDLIGSGSNDVPRAGGGIYGYDESHQNDSIFGYEPNTKEICSIIDDIIKIIKEHEKHENIEDEKNLRDKLRKESKLKNITEFHRSVHAEMQAILTATRNGLSTRNSTMYTTTFPCHNCTKHIVSAGIKEVIYVEPYPKSLAYDLHRDAIEQVEDDRSISGKINFRPFFGIGPRRFRDLFGNRKKKDVDGGMTEYNRREAKMRFKPEYYSFEVKETSYLRDNERIHTTTASRKKSKKNGQR